MRIKFDSESNSKTFGSRDNESLRDFYEDWASPYDEKYAGLGYRLPALVPGFLARYVPPTDRPVLDAGCGTGLTGANLRNLEYLDTFQMVKIDGCWQIVNKFFVDQ